MVVVILNFSVGLFGFFLMQLFMSPVFFFFFFCLLLENALKDESRIARAIGVCKKLVAHFSHSWKEKKALQKAQQEHNLPDHQLVTECPTRWGSRQKND